MNELIQQLVNGLGINQEQAEGGAGLLFQLAKDKLSSADFSQVADAVPDMDNFLDAAPESGGGLMGTLGGLLSAFGGDKLGDLGNLAELAGGFSKLDLDTGMIGKFVPIVLSFVQDKGGDVVADLLKKVMGTS